MGRSSDTRNSRRLGFATRTLILSLVLALSLVTRAQPPVDAQGDLSLVGQWSAPQPWPYRAIHAHMLPTAQLMFWDSYDAADRPQLWNPTTGSIQPAVPAGYNIFCSGFSFLPDGRLFVGGGHYIDNWGLPAASLYDPFTNSWTRLTDMSSGRWYPTATRLTNGDVLVVSGMADTSVGMNLLPQVWQLATGTWRNLTSAQLQLPYYPYMFLAPNGRVFNAGPTQTTRYLDTAGSGTWTVVGSTNYGPRNWGSAVMYEEGKVLIMGGIQGDFYAAGSAVAPTNTAEVIDLNEMSPAWRYVAPMTYPRKHHNATLLPDGTVLVIGGSSTSEDTNSAPNEPALNPELWNPTTNTWTTLASHAVYRGYHSTAVLLPDGRVVAAGGEHATTTAEVFSPPYLFKGSRPTITSIPEAVTYGQTFFVETPESASIAKVTWLAPSSVTHTNNMGQSFNRLSFATAPGGVNVTAPTNSAAAPPGYYMLFILNNDGVPSVARFIRLATGTAPEPPPPPPPPPPSPPAAPSGLKAAPAGTSQIDLRWTDNANNEVGIKIDRCLGGSNCKNYVEIAQVGTNVTTYSDTGLAVSTTYTYRVRAYNAAGVSAYSNPAKATTGR